MKTTFDLPDELVREMKLRAVMQGRTLRDLDTHVWLAVIFPTHPSHATAQQALQRTTPAQPAAWCRSTQQSFLRLASTPALHKAYGAERMTNRDALVVNDKFELEPCLRRRGSC